MLSSLFSRKQKRAEPDVPTTALKPETVTLLVMGPTGVGKSTFINLASGSDLRVSDSLASCTERIEFSKPFLLDGKEVVLVDTPGFDDSAKSDAEVLNIVCDYLASEYKLSRLLHGVLYLYRITDNRVSGTAARNLQFYQHLCGDDVLDHTALVTNFWGTVQDAVGCAREEELKSKPVFFKHALDLGARYARHTGTLESAQAVLRPMLGNTPCALRVQRELVDEGRVVAATTAGETLLRDLAKLMQQHQKEMEQVERELQDALREHDAQTQRELEEEREKLRAEQARLEAETKKLAQLKAERAQMGQAQARERDAQIAQAQARERDAQMAQAQARERDAQAQRELEEQASEEARAKQRAAQARLEAGTKKLVQIEAGVMIPGEPDHRRQGMHWQRLADFFKGISRRLHKPKNKA